MGKQGKLTFTIAVDGGRISQEMAERLSRLGDRSIDGLTDAGQTITLIQDLALEPHPKEKEVLGLFVDFLNLIPGVKVKLS